MPRSPTASLPEIRGAIQTRMVLEFTYGGEAWKVEPHDLSQNPHHSLVLHSWVLEGLLAGSWVVFLYSEIRSCRVLPVSFPARDVPPVLVEWRGPDFALRAVSRGDFRPQAKKRAFRKNGSNGSGKEE
jgi:hypothetical protein